MLLYSWIFVSLSRKYLGLVRSAALYRWILVCLFHKYLGFIKSTACYFTIEYQNHTGFDTSKECNVFHFYFFKDKNFLYQPLVCNECHYALLSAVLLTNFKIILVKGKSYRVVSNLLHDENYHLLESSSSIDKFWSLWLKTDIVWIS